MHIVFIGPPGAGKGTQCKRLALQLGLPHLSSGEMLRHKIAQDQVLAAQLASDVNTGKLAPDELVTAIVIQRLAQPDCRQGCLLDGFPRTLPQAELLDQFLTGAGSRLDLVFCLHVPNEVLVERLLKRAETERRQDDNVEAIQARLAVFERQTRPIIAFYQQRGLVCWLDGQADTVTIFKEMMRAMEAFLT